MGRSKLVFVSFVLVAAVGCAARPDAGGDPAETPADPPAGSGTADNGSPAQGGQPGASDTSQDPAPSTPAGTTAPAPGATARCDRTKPFGKPELVPGLTTEINRAARLSADEKSMYFTRATTNVDILHAQWSDADKAWMQIAPAMTLDTKSNDGSPSVTGDGLTMYFHSDRTTANAYDIWMSRRAAVDKDWEAPVKVTALSGSAQDVDPYVRPDGKMLVFSSTRTSNNPDLYVSYLDESGALTAPRALSELNTSMQETDPVLSADGLAMYFARGATARDIYVARRAKLDDKFGAATPIAELDSAGDDRPTWISADECVVYLNKADSSTSDHLYMAQRGR